MTEQDNMGLWVTQSVNCGQIVTDFFMFANRLENVWLTPTKVSNLSQGNRQNVLSSHKGLPDGIHKFEVSQGKH